jgi:exonuclease III
MSESFKIVTWNLHRAAATSAAWDYLLDINPDLALLQEVGAIPDAVTRNYACQRVRAMGLTALQQFHTAILVRGEIGRPIPLSGSRPWIDAILTANAGNLLAHEVHPSSGAPLKVISVYSPPFQIPARYREGADLDALRRTQRRGVWLTDVLLAALENCPPDLGDRWIIAGDFNLAETFDREHWSAGGNAAWLERMDRLGFTECLRQARGVPTPTFKHSGGSVRHQMDHVFVTRPLASQLITGETGDPGRVFASPLLSDHLPVIANFAS